MPIQGNPTTGEPQDEISYTVLSGQSTDGNSPAFDIRGLTGQKTVEVANSTAGTCSLKFQGSYDGVTWYAMGYHEIDSQTTLTRKAGNQAITANFTGVYVLEDEYDYFRINQNSSAGGPSITATFHGYPQS
jgi:hypothetical protein